jgi:putative flippase GtrA
MKIDSRGIKRFFKYSSVGFGTFMLDLVLLWTMVEKLGVNYLVATGSAFLIAVSINYLVSRKIVFNITKTKLVSGYINFIVIATFGIILTTGSVAVLTYLFGFYYLFARILTAGMVGIFNYILNLRYNFKVAGVYE